MSKELAEAMVDIALNAGYMIAHKEIEVGDSRELVSNIQLWAEEFIRSDQVGERLDEYIGAIDEFAARRLITYYGAVDVCNCRY